MSKILSEKQKETLIRARKSGKAYDLMQARKNGTHQDLADIIKKSKDLGNAEVEEADPLENWRKGWEVASKLSLDSDYFSVVARAKTAAIFGKLLDRGLDPEDLKAAVNEVTNAD